MKKRLTPALNLTAEDEDEETNEANTNAVSTINVVEKRIIIDVRRKNNG